MENPEFLPLVSPKSASHVSFSSLYVCSARPAKSPDRPMRHRRPRDSALTLGRCCDVPAPPSAQRRTCHWPRPAPRTKDWNSFHPPCSPATRATVPAFPSDSWGGQPVLSPTTGEKNKTKKSRVEPQVDLADRQGLSDR